jgi:hypothetical protein
MTYAVCLPVYRFWQVYPPVAVNTQLLESKNRYTERLFDMGRNRLLGGRDDVRTIPPKHRHLIRLVYQFFEKRASCGCDECREEFLDPKPRIARLKRRRRWNALPETTRECLFRRQKQIPGRLD